MQTAEATIRYFLPDLLPAPQAIAIAVSIGIAAREIVKNFTNAALAGVHSTASTRAPRSFPSYGLGDTNLCRRRRSRFQGERQTASPVFDIIAQLAQSVGPAPPMKTAIAPARFGVRSGLTEQRHQTGARRFDYHPVFFHRGAQRHVDRPDARHPPVARLRRSDGSSS